jgi:hypothetical protein
MKLKALCILIGLLTCTELICAGGVNAQQAKPIVPDIAHPFAVVCSSHHGGPLKHAQDLNAEYLLKLEPDRMLAYYRKRAGLEPKAEPYGGWDGDDRNLTGTSPVTISRPFR